MTRHWTLALVTSAIWGVAIAATSWQSVPAQSRLSFTAVQAGAEFEGAFKRFTAKVQFDPAAPASCRFDVSIETGSVDTQDRERDDLLRGADLFDAKRFPAARYRADRCIVQGKQFVAQGKLTLRNVTRDVPITFTFESKQGRGVLNGAATLKRLAFGVGQGEWKDTEWVADDVKVKFALQLSGS